MRNGFRGAWLTLLMAGILGCGGGNNAEQELARLNDLEPERVVTGWESAKWVDLTHPFEASTVYWPTGTGFEHEVLAADSTEGGYWYAASRYAAAEHGGTHLDAPYHFAVAGWKTHEIPMERLIGPAVVVDVSDSAAANPDYTLRLDDIRQWEAMNGAVPAGCIFLMRCNWDKKWPDPVQVFGSPNPKNTKTLHFPGFSAEAARFLVERGVDAVGIDTPSLDPGNSTDFVAHRIFAEANIPGFENVANLNRLPDGGAWIVAMPMLIQDGTGAPLRIVGVVP